MTSKKISQFYFNQLKSSKLFWISIILLGILPIALISLIYLINNNYYSVIYYYCLGLFIVMVMKISMLSYLVSSNNIHNSVDFDLLTESVSRNKIFWSKFKVISIIEFSTIAINTFFGGCIAAAISRNGGEIATVFLINLFGESLLAILFIFLCLFITYKFSKIVSTTINTWLGIIIPALSLISHTALISPSNSLEYQDNQKQQYQNIVILDKNKNVTNEYIGIKNNYKIQDYSSNTISDYTDSITRVNFGANFNVGDWFFSPFYVIGKNHLTTYQNINDVNNLNQNGYMGSLIRFNLKQEKLLNSNYSFENIASNNIGDVNIFKLSSKELFNEIYKGLDSINNSSTSLSLTNQNLVQSLLVKLQREPIWIKSDFDSSEISTINSLIGMSNKECNIFYYIFKNIDYVLDFVPNIFDEISLKYSQPVGNLLKYLYTDNKSIWNIESFQGFVTSAEIDKKYGNIKVKDPLSKPLQKDLDFVKNYYLKFETNGIKILSSDYTYKDSLNKSISIGGSQITNQLELSNYVDQISTLQELENLSNVIQQNIATPYIFNPSANVVDLNSYDFFATTYNITWFEGAEVIFGLYFVAMVVACYVFWRKSVTTNYR